MKRVLFIALLSASVQAQTPATFDIILRNGSILDGSGLPRFNGDVGIRGDYIAAVGDLSKATATTDVDVSGMFVAPGFINIHAHPSPDALPTAVNMLTQGVTTEITNPDGGGPVDLAAQLSRFQSAGLAENIGGFIGFNAIWQAVVGNSDRRPTPEEIEKMRGMITAGLEQGAWGVSAGLDYKPGYFAQTEEVVRVVDAARPWRTLFTNHDRITPESHFSSRVGIEETLAIGQKSGLVPIVTHMKVQGIEQGTASSVLATMRKTTQSGAYTAADAYPYLAGQSGLGALIIPGWAQEGGRPEMLKRFADPATRARIVKEAEEAMTARFGGPQGVYLPRSQRELTDVMKEMNAGPAETIIRILEAGPDPGAILRFGSEADLVKILQEPVTSMACDCGATIDTRVHPRFYGSFTRLLGRYVREQKIMSWEEAIRKSTALPAATIGLVDRGYLAPGMMADVTVFDPDTVIDRSTYESPALQSEGIRQVLVNGRFAIRDGAPTGAKIGRALRRAKDMPSRPMSIGERRLKTSGRGRDFAVTMDLSQAANARAASGTLTIDTAGQRFRVTELGVLQFDGKWGSISAVAEGLGAVTVIVDHPTNSFRLIRESAQ